MIVSFDLHAACTYNFTRFLITFFLLIAIHDDPVKKLHQAGKELQHGGHIPLHLLPFSWPNPWNLLISLCLPVTIQVKGEVHNFSTTSNTNSRKAFQTCRSLEWPGIFIMFVLFHSNSCTCEQGWHWFPLHCFSVDSFLAPCEWVKLHQIYFYKLWCIFTTDMNDKVVQLGVFDLSCYFFLNDWMHNFHPATLEMVRGKKHRSSDQAKCSDKEIKTWGCKQPPTTS